MHGTQRKLVGGFVGTMALAIAIVGCKSGSTDLAFKGRCTDSKGHAVRAFTLAVAPASAPAARPVTVAASPTGEYQTRVKVSVATGTSDRLLGSRSEKVAIRVAAPGYKPKTFNVTADQLMTGGEVNTLNVNLEPAS